MLRRAVLEKGKRWLSFCSFSGCQRACFEVRPLLQRALFPRGEFPVTTVWFGGLEALGITESDRRFQIGSLQRFCWAVFIGSMAPQLKTITATKKQSD